jgi:hypothetical protein
VIITMWEARCLLLASWLLARSACSSILKLEEIYFFKTSVNFYQITQSYIPKDSNVHKYCNENFKSHMH